MIGRRLGSPDALPSNLGELVSESTSTAGPPSGGIGRNSKLMLLPIVIVVIIGF